MITRRTIDEIMSAAVIEEVIGDFVQLKKAGSSYKGLSPFTNEKTPSFFVSPAKGIFKCFSSGKGGDVVSFLMEQERLSYPEALRYLADKYNIEVEEDKPSPEQEEAKSELDSLAVVTSFAQKYFTEQLWQTDEGKAVGLSYFKERGFRDEIIKRFELGYCPDGWDNFTKAALEAGHDRKWLVAAGLTKDRDGSSYDFFRGRVMFPIRNISGKCIAFGGRTLKADKKIAKYFNSPESLLYNKSRVLYGIYESKQAMVKQDQAYLVEGYTDVIAMHQAGVENVVSSSGTSLTEGQIKLIKRYTQNITLLYDGDPAGIKASFRGIDLILEQSMNVKVVLFPDGDDPDSYSKKVSSTELQKYIQEEAKDFIVFKTDLLLDEAKDDPIKRAGLIREIVTSIAQIPDAIQRSVYLRECSHLLEVDERVLLTETNALLRKRLNKKPSRGHQEEPPPDIFEPPTTLPPQETSKISTLSQEKDFVRILLNYGNYTFVEHVKDEESGQVKEESISVAEYLIHEWEDDIVELHDPLCKLITEEYANCLNEDHFPEPTRFTQHENREVCSMAADLLAEQYQLSENWSTHKIFPETELYKLSKAAKDAVNRLKLQHVLAMMEQVQDELKDIDPNDDDLLILLQKRKQLDQAKQKLSAYFGSTIL